MAEQSILDIYKTLYKTWGNNPRNLELQQTLTGMHPVAREFNPIYTVPRGVNTLQNAKTDEIVKALSSGIQQSTNPFSQPISYNQSAANQQMGNIFSGLLDITPAIGAIKPVVKPVGKAIAGEMARQIETGTGLIGKNIVDPRMYAYLPDTPKSPNPLVGTRFESKAQGNLVPEIPLKIEDLKGGSIKIVPYDLTNADQLISSVSGEALNNPVYTMGGKNFSRLQQNYDRNIGGASNLEIAKRVAGRIDTTRKENIAKGGTGEVFKLPMTMGQNSEFFSTYPTDILKQLAVQNGDKKSIKQLNEWLRNAPVATPKGQVRPFGNFKGIETPEGQQQLLTGEGFGAKGTAGEFRKAFAAEMAKTRNERAFGYNFKDVKNSVLDPDLINLPKGMAGNTVVKSFENTSLTPSSLGSNIGAYDTDIAGKYWGRLETTPVDILMPKTYNNLYQIFAKKYPDKHPNELRNMTIAAMEKRKENIGELVDNQVIENYYKYHEGLLGK